MKLTTTLTSLAVLIALTAFLITPVGAEDEPAPPAPRADDGPPPRPAEGMRDLRLVLAADADRDRTVSAEEWQAFLARLGERFEALDENGDGALDADELPEPPRRPRMRGGQGQGRPDAGPGRHERRGRGMRQGHGRGMRGEPIHAGPRGKRDMRGGPQRGGPGMRGHGMRGPRAQGMRGPRAQPNHGGDLAARLDRLTSALEKLLERMEDETPR
ncbi:MAG: hypothetical protein QNJ90_09320 [Planctomycetota bacterium]|nr:hypothetical protein [Planctomycetota bacterium]